MKKQASKKQTPATEETETAAIQTDTLAAPDAKAKPAKKKKPAVEAASADDSATQPAATVKKPVKKVAKKAEKTTPAKAAPGESKSKSDPAPEAEPEAASEENESVEAPAPVAPKKPGRKARGRDLVVDEPGAEEVADVLGDHAEDLEESLPDSKGDGEEAGESARMASPEGKLERLQKILAKAGISSRRKAEELILGGRVQINGKVVMELGTKADMARDHVRVDGKLLQGAERIRYFVLNKPKGFVTTVSDPEGRPTVMQFFSAERERLYPVGRLDYLSEGLLLVTNDGELANKLTKAASGVEKTYLVKVAGQPTEDMLDVLRAGVVIERGRQGTNSGRVRTAPAKIRQVRQGDNPWYEVIVIEGRNRELRKMFEEIGHHVEKIRRIGYGPLVLDLEPGKQRELEPEEVHQLRLVADGKLKPRRRRGPAEAQLPTVAGKTVRYKKADGKPGYEPRTAPQVRPEFQQESKSEAPSYSRAEAGRTSARPPRPLPNAASRPQSQLQSQLQNRPQNQPQNQPENRREAGSAAQRFEARPAPDSRPASRPAPKSGFGPSASNEGSDRRSGRNAEAAPRAGFRPGSKPAYKSSSRPPFGKGPAGGRPAFGTQTRRPEPQVTDYVLPPRKTALPDDFDDQATDRKPDFRTEGKTGAKPERRPPGKTGFKKDGPAKRFGGGDRFDSTGASTAAPYGASERTGTDSKRSSRAGFDRTGSDRAGFDRTGSDRTSSGSPAPRREDYPDGPAEKRIKIGIEPVPERSREERPRSGGFARAGGGKSFRPQGARPPSSASPFRPRPDGPREGDRREAGPRENRPPQAERPGKPEFRPRPERPFNRTAARPSQARPSQDGPRTGRPAGQRKFTGRPAAGRPPEFRSRQAGPETGPRTGPSRFGSRSEGSGDAAPRRAKPFAGSGDRPREFKPGAPKKLGARSSFAGSRAGSDGPPRGDAPVKKERWRNSFTGKNKGRPKPKGKKDI